MPPVYAVKSDANDRKTWIDWFVTLEPKGGVPEVVERGRTGNGHRVPGGNGHAVLDSESVAYTVVARL